MAFGSGGLVGRVAEVTHLAGLVAGLRAGRGGVVWVEGEPGIGKSSVLATGLAGAAEPPVEVFWGVCDELGKQLPLRVLTACMRVEEAAPDGPAAMLRLVDSVARAAVARPVVLVVDDAQWADASSLMVLAELARLVGQLPLLLAVAARPVPRRAEVVAARRAVLARGGAALRLSPLMPAEVNEQVRRLLRGRPGQGLREAAQAAGGNPLYVRELVDALVRENRIRSQGEIVELAEAATGSRSPVSLAGAISDRLAFLSEGTIEVLRLAAVLGAEFSVPDLSTVVGRPPSALVTVVQEALAAGVLAESGRGLQFRHGLIRQGLAGSMPAGLQSALHAQVARTLLESGAGMERIAEQLLAAVDAGVFGAAWVLDWLVRSGPRLVNRAPEIGAELLRAALEAAPVDGPRREELTGLLLTALWLNWQDAEVEQLAGQIIADGGDPEWIGAAAWRMVYAICGRGTGVARMAEGVRVAEELLAGGRVSGRWLIRLRALYGNRLGMLGRHEESEAVGQAVLADSTADHFAVGYALQGLAQVRWRVGDIEGGRAYFERALAAIGSDVETTDLRLILLIQRALALHFTDRLAETRQAVREALRLAEHAAPPRLALNRLMAADLWFDTGDWDDALAELEDLHPLVAIDQVAARCIQALIAMHRDEPEAAAEAMRQLPTGQDRELATFAFGGLSGVRVLAAERAGDSKRVVAELGPMLDLASATANTDPTGCSNRYRVLPTVVRAALAVRDVATARVAAADAAAEADRAGTRSVRAVAEHTRGLLAGDGAVLRAAGDELASIGRPLLAGQAFEDAAVAYAEGRKRDAARVALEAALACYGGLDAGYDIRRAKGRLRRYGLRSAERKPQRPVSGWEALTPAEVNVAKLLRAGKSNPDIATELFLSRRTVESHVSHILTKLGAKSRLEVIASAHSVSLAP